MGLRVDNLLFALGHMEPSFKIISHCSSFLCKLNLENFSKFDCVTLIRFCIIVLHFHASEMKYVYFKLQGYLPPKQFT